MIREMALKYLGYGQHTLSEDMEKLLDTCIKEVKQVSQPRVTVKQFRLAKEPLRIYETGDAILGKQMEELLKDCPECLLIGCTLGLELERKLKFYAKIDMTKAAVMDAVASAWLEEFCDEYESGLGYPARTYRACPGYGDFPLEFNRTIASLLDISRKIGVTITASNLLIPQKSMLGVIGIGDRGRGKSCGNCVMRDDCPFRKRGQRCYEIESEKIC